MPDVHKQQALLAKLDAAAPLDDATAFVLLWTYFEAVGLTDVENSFVRRGMLPQTIPPYPKSAAGYLPAAAKKRLESQQYLDDFDQAAIAWLKGIDRLLSGQTGTFEETAIEGFDGRTYRVRPANNAIASWFAENGREVAGARKQSLSLAAYCRHFRAVPAAVKGIGVECVGSAAWSDPSIDDRLRLAFQRGLKFLCCPLKVPLHVANTPAFSENGEPRTLLRVTVGGRDDDRRDELSRAIAAARERQAAILVLPELSIATRDLAILREILSEHGPDDHPILVVAGVEHALAPRGRFWVNEAVVIGPYGHVLRRQRKLSRYGDADYAEQIETGTILSILESPIGNLATPICLDMFNTTVYGVVSTSHANVLLVPSLSRKTTAHQRIAYNYLASNLAATIVSNRWLDGSGREGSFAVLPGKNLTGDTIVSTMGADDDLLLVDIQQSFK